MVYPEKRKNQVIFPLTKISDQLPTRFVNFKYL